MGLVFQKRIFDTDGQRPIYNPVRHLRCNFFCENIFTNSSIVDIRLDSKYVFDGDTRKAHENFEKHSFTFTHFTYVFPVDIYMFKVNNKLFIY